MTILLKIGSSGEEVVLLQRALNELGNYNLVLDGSFGPGTANSLKNWQKQNGFLIDGIYNSNIHRAISDLIAVKYIRLNDIDEFAKSIGIEPNILKAITLTESKGAGFFNNGTCKILFERHVFYNQVLKKFDKRVANNWMNKFPNLCHPVWSQSSYLGGVREWDRLSAATDLDPESALLSTSWGMFQVMGFNYGLCGYENVGDFVADLSSTEKYQIAAITMFIRNVRPLYRACIEKNFNEISKNFNGASYASHGYHIKLKNNYIQLTN
jgi:hypothetical protein